MEDVLYHLFVDLQISDVAFGIGTLKFVLNALSDLLSILMEFVLQFLLSVQHGIPMELVQLVIMDIL